MKTKTTFKKRLMSGLLALVMVLGFLPANLFPAANADGVNGTLSAKVYADGSYEIVFTGSGSTATTGLGAVFTLDGGVSATYVPSNKAADGTLAPTSTYTDLADKLTDTTTGFYQVPSSAVKAVALGTPSISGNTYTWKGNAGAIFTEDALRTTVSTGTFYDKDGNPITSSREKMPVCVMLCWGNVFGFNVCASAYCDMEPPAVVDLTTTDFTYTRNGPTIVGSTTPSSAMNITSSDAGLNLGGTVAQKPVGDGGVASVVGDKLTGVTLTAKFTSSSTSGIGAAWTNYLQDNSGLIKKGSDSPVLSLKPGSSATLEPGDYYLLLKARANIAAAAAPITGTVTIEGTTPAEQKIKKTINVVIRLNDSTYMTSTGGITIRGTQGKLDQATADITALGLTIVPGTVYSADTSAKVVSSTSSKGWSEVTAPTGTTGITTSNLDFGLTSAKGQSLTVGEYDETLDLVYSVAKQASGAQGYMVLSGIPVHIVVLPAEVENTHTVTFNGNGGTPTSTTQSVNDGSPAIKPTEPTRDGYIFGGWYTATTGGTLWNFSDPVTADLPLYAHWFQVTFNGNVANAPGQPSTTTPTLSNLPTKPVPAGDSRVSWPTPDTKLTGYDFVEWNTEADGTGTSWTSGSSPKITGDTTFYARWKQKPITFENVTFSGKQDAIPTIAVSSLGPGYATCGDHTSPATATEEEDFSYKFSANENGPWTADTYDDSANTGLIFKIKDGKITTENAIVKAMPLTFYVQATSKLNGAPAKAKVELQVPPRVTGGSLADGDIIQAGKKVTLKKLTLSDGSKVSSAAGDVAPSHIIKLEWWVGQGGVMIPGTNASNQGPTINGKISDDAGSWELTIPGEDKAPTGSHLWVRVVGDDDPKGVDMGAVQSDGTSRAMWVDLGEIGKERRTIEVKEAVFDLGNNKLTSTPDNISSLASLGQVGSGERSELRTTNNNPKYEFLGWSLTGASPTTGVSNGVLKSPSPDTDCWTVTGEGNAHTATGRNNATFEMTKLPTSTNNIVIYAVYKEIETYTITVKGDTNIHQVTDGNKVAAGGSAGFTLNVTQNDIVNLSATPADNCINKGIEITITGGTTPANPGDYFQIATDTKSSITLRAAANITVTFTATPVADLHATGEAGTVSDKVGYTPSVAYTVTLTNPGTKDATIAAPADVKLYTTRGGTTESDKFDITTKPSSNTVAAKAGVTGSGVAAPKYVITPIAGLEAGSYTAWLHIVETTDVDTIKSGVQLDEWFQITFVVTEKDTFDGTVTVLVNNATPSTGTYQVRLGDDTTTEESATSGTVTYNGLKANQSYTVKVNNGSGWVDSGKVLSVGADSATVNYYTLTLAADTGASRVSFASTGGAASVNQVVLEGTVVPIYATPNTGYDPNSLKWELSDAVSKLVANSAVEVRSQVTATASYEVGHGVVYMWNKGTPDTAYSTDNTYYAADDAAVPLPTKPTRPGYTFGGWAKTSGGAAIASSATAANLAMTAISSGGTATDANGRYILYAVWTKVADVWTYPDTDGDGKGDLPKGVYGGSYSATAAITNGAATGAVTYAVTTGSLPKGLEFNTATGVITGKPRETGTFPFTVTATNSENVTWTNDYTLKVDAATPTIAAISFDGVEQGADPSTITVYATVTAPLWDTTVTGDDKWVTKQYTYSASSTPNPNPGALSVAHPTGNLDFGSNTTLSGQVKFTSSNSVETGFTNTDGSKQKFNQIYTDPTVGCVFTLSGKIYNITVDPAYVDASIDVGDNLPSAPWSFKVTNQGNQVANLTYALQSGVGTPDNFELTVKEAAKSIAVGSEVEGAFTVALKDVDKAVPGVYTTNVVITQTVDDGTKITYVPITFKVKEVDYIGSVQIDLKKADGTSSDKAELPAGNVVLKEIGSGSGTTVTTTRDASGLYKGNLLAGKSYTVVVNGYTIPGKVVSSANKNVPVTLYQVAVENESESATDTVSGIAATPAYLAPGQTGKVSAPASATNGGKTYNFEKWVKDNADPNTTVHTTYREFSYQMPDDGSAAAVIFHAYYVEKDAETVQIIYLANAGSDAVVVPGSTTVNVGSTTDKLAAGNPVRPGYDFVGWSTDQNATKADFNTTTNADVSTRFDALPGASVPALVSDLTLHAVWSKQTPTWPSATLPSTTYGATYGASVAITAGLNTSVKYTLKSGDSLPGGLKLNEDGTITGRPYEVGTKTFAVVATYVDNEGLKWTTTDNYFTITVGKAQPTLVNVSGTGAMTGQEFRTGTYSVDVLAPKLIKKATETDSDKWNDEDGDPTNDYVVQNVAVGTSAAAGGELVLTTPAATFASGKNEVKMTWKPGASTATDDHGNHWGAIYKEAPGTATVYTSGETYTMTVEPTTHKWTVEVDYAAADHTTSHDGDVASNTAYGKKFTLTNTGNQATGTLTYKFKSTDNNTGTWFALESTAPTTSLDPEGTATFYVKPKAGQTTPGTYTDTLTVTNEHDGTAVVYTLTLVVEKAANFEFEVDTKLHTTTNVAGALDDVDKVELKPTKAGASTITMTAASTSNSTKKGIYTCDAILSDTSYTVVVNGYATNVVIDDATANAKVVIDLYQVLLTQSPAHTVSNLTLTKVGGTESGATASYYYVKGQPYMASVPSLAATKSVTKWTEHLHKDSSTATDIGGSKGQTSASRVMGEEPVTLTVYFEDLYEVVLKTDGSTMTITGGGDYTSILTGGKVADSKYFVAKDATFGLPSLDSGKYTITKAGHTFRGWTTDVDDVGTASAANYNFTANEAADGGDKTDDNIITLYPVWTEDSTLALSPGVIKGVYKHELTGQKVGPASGGDTSSYTYSSETTLPFSLTLTSGTGAVTGKPNEVGSQTATIKVTDGSGNTKTALYTFVIDKANMKLGSGDTLPSVKVDAGTVSSTIKSTIEGKLNDPATGVKPDGDGTEETDISGSWSVTGTIPTEPGTYAVEVTYTPKNEGTGTHLKDADHYNKFVTTIPVTVAAKLIRAATVTIQFPKDTTQTPQGKDDATVTAVTPSEAVVDIKSVTWSGSGYNKDDNKFAPTKDIMLTVVLTPNDPATWNFIGNTADFLGTFVDGNSGSSLFYDNVDVSCSATEAVLTYTWLAADSDIGEILVQVTAPSYNSSIANNKTALCAGTPVGSFKPELVKWVKEDLDNVNSTNYTTLDAAGGNFEVGTYTVIVTATANSSYKFTNIFADLNGSDAKAQINNNNAKILAKDFDTGVVTIAYEFEVVSNPIRSLTSATGPMVYYAQTGTNDKHHENTNATGNKSGIGFTLNADDFTVSTVNSAGETATTTDFQLFVDVNGNGKYDAANDILLTTTTTHGAATTSYTFSDVDPAHASTHGSDLDGKSLYAVYAPSGTMSTDIAPVLAGVLTVRPLEAKGIKSTFKDEVVLANGDVFPGFASGTVTTTVDFNTDSAGLSNPGVNIPNCGSKPTTVTTPAGENDYRATYYYMLDVDGDSAITNADLELNSTNTLSTAAHHNKGIYACYTDVNGHLVYTRVGTLKMEWTFIADITDGNGGEPEYGDPLTGVPMIPKDSATVPDPDDPDDWQEDDPNKYDYVWERKDPDDPGSWIPIPGAIGPGYVPDKPDVEETIRVVITDRTTGMGMTKEIKIQPRTLHLDVRPVDKKFDGTATNGYTYLSSDFTLSGIVNNDAVKVSYDGTGKPNYSGLAVGSTITWPEINDTSRGYYTFTGTGATKADGTTLVYRLAGQGTIANRGQITDGNVTHVDVSFKEMPTFGHDIPNAPMGVTDSRETQAGAGGQTYVANWYTGTYTPGTSSGSPITLPDTFGAGAYTVVVAVKPVDGYNYDTNTKYYFHFGEGTKVEVSTAAGLYVKDGVYYMYHTFDEVARPKIAHVNVSVVQPVVEVAPVAAVSENQVLGTDGSDRKDDLTPTDVTWYDAATGGNEVSATDQFAGDKVYRAEFDLTATNDFKFDSNVEFVVNGIGPFKAGDTGTSNIITSVKATKKTGEEAYHVVVVFEELKGGKVDLTDVVVDASRATAAGVKKTGPEITGTKPYALTGSDNVWQFWNKDKAGGAGWDDISAALTDGNFMAGYDYRVTATVKLTDGDHYQIGTNTKFYLAGLECKKDDPAELHTTGDKTLKANADGTYTLIQEFRIPANEVGMINVTYDLPLNSGTTIPTAPQSYGAQTMVNIAAGATTWVSLGTDDSAKSDFTSAGSAPGTTFAESQYYRVTSVVTPKTGYKFTSGTVVVINGVAVTVDAATPGEIKENDTTVAYVKAVTDGDNIKAMLIAKVRSTAIDPIELAHEDMTPVAEMAPSNKVFTLARDGESRYEVDTSVHNGGKGTWEFDDNGTWKEATVANNGLDASGNFLSGTKYRVTVGVKVKDTNVFATGASGTVDNAANSTKKTATVSVAGDRKTATLTVTFDPTNINTATVVDVYFNRQPEVGKTVGLQESSNYIYKFPASVNNAPTETVGTLTGTGMAQFDVKWYDTTDIATFDPKTNTKTAMGDTGKFEAHKKYTVTVKVNPAAGWQYILDTDPGTVDTKFTIFASAAGHASNVWYDTDNGNYVMWYTFETGDDPSIIVRVAANVAQPVAGATRPTVASKLLAQNGYNDDMLAHVTVKDLAWTVSNTANGTYNTASGTTFEANRYYRATFKVEANTNYSFLNDDPDYVDFLINGVTNDDGTWINGVDTTGVTKNGITVTTALTTVGDPNSYTVTVTFPVTGSVANILTVWGNAKVPVAGTDIDPDDITVPGTEPYGIVSGTNKWYTNEACTTEPTEAKFKPNTTYYARLTVKLKDDYAGIYQFAQTTEGYINDTTANATVVARDPATGIPTTITLTRSFTTDPASDDLTVYGNVVAPTAEATASKDAITAIASQPYTKVDASTEWQDENGDPFTGTFVAGKTYTAVLTVKVNNINTHKFVADTKGYLNNVEIDGTNGTKKTVSSDGSTMTLKMPFEVPLTQTTVVVNSAPPANGNPLPTTITEGDNTKYTFTAAAWTGTLEGGNAKANTEYTLTVTVTPATGCALPDNVGGYTWNGYVAQTITGAGSGKYTVTFKYTTPAEGVQPVTEIPANAEAPIANQPLNFDGWTSADFDVVSDVEWYEGEGITGTQVTDHDEPAKYSQKYTAAVTVKLKSSKVLSDDPTYKFNGVDITANGASHSGPDADGNYTLIYTFPTTGEKPADPVSEIPANAEAPIANQPLNYTGWTSPDFTVVGDVKWYEGENTSGTEVTNHTTPAKYSQKYTAAVTVKLKPGKELAEDPTYTFNGVELPATNYTDNGDGTYTLIYTFPTTGPKPADPAREPIITVKEPVKGEFTTGSEYRPTSPNTSVTINGYTWSPSGKFEAGKSYTIEVEIDPARLPAGTGTLHAGDTIKFNNGTETIYERDGKLYVKHTWTLPTDPPPEIISDGGGGGTTTITEELPVVTYWISDHGFTNDLTAEKVSKKGAKPTFTPKVSGKEGYTFKGWSEEDPAKLKQGEEIKLVNPLTFSISEDKTFYAVYDEPRFEHNHYASGYPDGTFKPDQFITRAEVAAIVANSCLDGFDNSENYGNPGNYSDINPKKWYGNDVAYCTMYGVFSGYKDGTFKPDQYITRQELAVVVANMAGMQPNIGMPFTDATSINKWARDGVYTVYKNNWVSGYPDGTFRPQNNITRAETVAIFNGYLHRGVDKDGLAELTPFVLNAAAGGYEGDGVSQYMTWTDVPEKYWAYYHIIEATNDHDYHWPDEETNTPPEHWDAAYQDETWRYREEFPVTYEVGSYGAASSGSVLTLSVKSGGKPRTQPHIDAIEGYTFLGWSLTADGAIVEPLQTTITGETTFYAVYEVKTTRYTVRYDAGTGGAITGASTESVVEGQTPVSVPDVNAHEGYTFLGWAESPNGALVRPVNLTITADKTYYAVYEAEEPEIQLLRHVAYMSGYEDGTFRPSQAITRAEVVTMVVRALGTDYDPDHVYDTSSVTDVEGHSAQNMIGYCIEKGIFSGYKDGTFLPEGTMTRQEFAVVIANLAGGAVENQGLPFTDADRVNKWARNAVYTVYTNGWIGGYKDGSFQPRNNITRAEAAVIFNGFLNRSVDKTSLTDVPAGATSPWSDVKVKNWAYPSIMEATTSHSYYMENGVEHWAEP